MAIAEHIVSLRHSISLALALLVSGCADKPKPTITPVVIAELSPSREPWEDFASDEDRSKITRLIAVWDEAITKAKSAGYGAGIEKEGALLKADAGLAHALPSPGSYRCRIIRIGAAGVYKAYPSYFCYVGSEDRALSVTKQTGSDRFGGYLYPGSDDRLVFIGSMALANEEVPPRYGDDRERDVVGIFERVGSFRYRLALPWPRAGTKLDILELVPHLPSAADQRSVAR